MGNEGLAPAVPLDDRKLGADFSARDGWSMYHGRSVPGFPQHPHRGFETVTYARQGFIDHSDSLGATARFGAGDTQWMTAGAGIVHAEMFPLMERERPNPLELFQIWLNLPAQDKLVEPHFAMLWGAATPTLEPAPGVRVTVVAGPLLDDGGAGGAEGAGPAPPPPHSWAARAESEVAIWHLHLADGGAWTLPAAHHPDVLRTLYHFAGDALRVDGEPVAASTAVVLDPRRDVAVEAGPAASEILLLQGRPIAEPVAQHGPFVMNTRAEIEQAFRDYQRTGFGGWPWPVDDPTHDRDRGRFARHADGRVEVL